MIRGVGIDLVRIARLERIVSGRFGDAFKARCFTPGELAYAAARGRASITALAARWAAKEAASKALGCGIGSECALLDLEISVGENGAPSLRLSGAAAAYAAGRGGGVFHVSLTHEAEYASAVVVWEV